MKVSEPIIDLAVALCREGLSTQGMAVTLGLAAFAELVDELQSREPRLRASIGVIVMLRTTPQVSYASADLPGPERVSVRTIVLSRKVVETGVVLHGPDGPISIDLRPQDREEQLARLGPRAKE